MKSTAFLLFIILATASAVPAVATTPTHPPPDPARLEAARALVQSLPIAESLAATFPEPHPVRRDLVASLTNRAISLHPRLDLDRLGYRFHLSVNARVDQALPEIGPAIFEDIAVAFAYMFEAAQLEAAAAFYQSSPGRPFARRLVSIDPIFRQAFQNRLFVRIAPEVESMLAEAEADESFREQVNSAR